MRGWCELIRQKCAVEPSLLHTGTVSAGMIRKGQIEHDDVQMYTIQGK
jgi:hypothetical protein